MINHKGLLDFNVYSSRYAKKIAISQLWIQIEENFAIWVTESYWSFTSTTMTKGDTLKVELK